MADEKIKEMTLRSTTMSLSAQSHSRGQISLPKWFCVLHQLGSSGHPHKTIDVAIGGVQEAHSLVSGYEIKALPDTVLFKKARPGARLTIEVIHPKPFRV